MHGNINIKFISDIFFFNRFGTEEPNIMSEPSYVLCLV